MTEPLTVAKLREIRDSFKATTEDVRCEFSVRNGELVGIKWFDEQSDEISPDCNDAVLREFFSPGSQSNG